MQSAASSTPPTINQSYWQKEALECVMFSISTQPSWMSQLLLCWFLLLWDTELHPLVRRWWVPLSCLCPTAQSGEHTDAPGESGPLFIPSLIFLLRTEAKRLWIVKRPPSETMTEAAFEPRSLGFRFPISRTELSCLPSPTAAHRSPQNAALGVPEECPGGGTAVRRGNRWRLTI